MSVLSSRRRREEIVRLATTAGLASVVDLADTFGVSASTIRRDLAKLEEQRQLARTYGGAMAHHAHTESSLRDRIGEAFEDKQAIARWAAAQVEPGESILLDAGSTVAALAHELRNRSDLSITTTSLTALNELAGSEDLTVHCLGGTLRPVSQGLVGPMAEIALERLSFDRVFLGADSVDADRGICEANLQQTRLKELMARRAERVYVLAHGAKLGRRPFHAWAQLPSSWTLVTTAGEADVEPFVRLGVTVVNLPRAGS
jgi:DeoR/GlpR family transcriptional regulator of sugar metabolism